MGEGIEKDGFSAVLFSEEHRSYVVLPALFCFKDVILTLVSPNLNIWFKTSDAQRKAAWRFIFSWNWCILSQRGANKHGTLKISLLWSCLSQICSDLWWVSALLSTTSQTKVRMGHESLCGYKSVTVDVPETSIDLLTYIHAIDSTSSSMLIGKS